MAVDYSGGIFAAPQAATFANPEKWLVDIFQGQVSDSGTPVTDERVLGATAAFYAINLISNDVAQIPLRVMSRNRDGGDTEDRRHPGGKIMRTQPMATTTPFHQRKAVQVHACTYGNGRAYIVRTGRQEPAELVPLDAKRMRSIIIHTPDNMFGGRSKWHLYYPENGGPAIPFPDWDVLHIHGLSLDGVEGLDMLATFRNSHGLTIGQEKVANRFYRNNAVPSIVLEAPAGAFRTPEEAQEFIRRFNDYHAGQDNAGRAGLLREGIKATVLSQAAKDNQMLEAREFQVREVMRIYGVPMIPGVSDSQSYNTLEQLNRAYLQKCLGPWLKNWEAECNAKLLTKQEQQTESAYFEFDTTELIRPDAAQFAEMMNKYIASTILSPNEARNELGYPPREGGDEYGNPATSSPNQQQPEPKDDPPAEATARIKRMAAAKLRPLVAMEKRRIAEMAGRATDFCGCVADFYAKHLSRLADAIAEIEGPSWLAAAHCEEMQEIALHLAGKAKTAEELTDAVNQAAAAWDQRLDDMAAACAGG